jgi:uncharacterized protein (TIRG00374 family)
VLLATIHEYRSILLNSLGDFGHIKPGAVAVAVVLESASMAAFARMQRRVLKSAGLSLTIESMLAITYAGNAIAVTLPLAGSGLGTAFLHREFSARGATHSVAVWALMLSGVYSTVAFGLIISIGALTSGNLAAEFAGIAGVAVVLLPLAGVIVAARHDRTREKLVAISAWVLKQVRRVTKKKGEDPETEVRDAISRVESLRLSRMDRVVVSLFATINWAGDIGCLAFAIRAVGLKVPWADLILAWAAGAGAASFNLTPGGLGVVEPALAAALVAAKLPSTRAMSAVLLYRFISFWLVLAVGWVTYAIVRRSRREA